MRDAINQRKKDFYQEKVQHLRTSDPRKWWNIVNKISGKSSNSTSISYEDEAGNVISGANLAMRLNKFYISVTSDISPLDASMLPAFLPAQEELPVIRPSEVYKKLLNISPFKAIGPDEVPNRIWKKFAPELATPVTDIFNASFSSGSFPTLWKDSYISPISKVTPACHR